MKTKRQHPRRLGLVFEPLEPRFLLSADLVPLDASLVSDPLPPVPAVYRALQPVDAAPQVAMQLEAPAREVVFVDGGIEDHAQLAADFLRATGGEREIDVVVLDPGRDGVEQIGEALAARRGLAAVHVLSHGADGAVALGATTLDSSALAARAATIGRWAQAFAADGDILFYGCDLAATADGEAFLADLARLTGADIAASSDLTGSRALGGDWDLEFATGTIEWTMPPLAAAEASWTGVLAQLDWDDPAVDWPVASLGPASFPVGGGDVTIQVQPNLVPMSTTSINNGSPDDDALVDQGGLAVTEQGLYVSSTGFDVGESALITIDFSHAGGVSNVSFTIFDIDLGTFTDEVQAAYTASGPVTLTITDSLNNDLVAADTVRGIAGTSSTGVASGDANATFTFAGTGITQIALTYRNAGGVSGQSITLHDIGFNVSPVAAGDGYAIAEDATLNVAAAGVLANDTDADGPALSAVLATGPANASAFTLNADGSFSYTPSADWSGVDTFTYRASDGIAQSALATVTITVAAVGDTLNDAVATDEDNAVATNVLVNDSFENAGRTLTGVVGAANGTVGFTPLGAITYTPNPDWNGFETLTYTVTSGGVTETGTLTITVDAVNDAPALALGANQTVSEDSGAHLVAGFATAAPGGGPDEAGQTFTYAVTNDNNALFATQPSIAPDGTLTYTLAADALGAANVLVSVTDSGGTTNGGVATTGPLAFTITATGVADTPSVTNAATLEDTQTAAGLVITRSPADGPEVTHFKITALTGGTLFLDDGTTAVATGSFVTAAQGAAGLRFTPAADSVTPGSFDVQASTDANDAGLGGSVVTATIAVTAVNDEPSFAIAGNQTVAEDSGPHSAAGFATAAPGGGPDEAVQTFAYTVTNDNNALFATQPSIAPNGTLTYTLAPEASGAATVTLFVTDSGGALNGGDDASPAQTFTIAVTPVADAPSLTVNPAVGDEDTAIPLTVTASLVDTDGSETLALSVSAIPIGATLSDGLASFTASAGSQTVDVTAWNLATLSVLPPAQSDADFNLTLSATSTEAANGFSATVSANLAVTVDPVADAPALVVAPAAGNEDTAIALAIGAALADTDGSESLSVELDALPVGAVLADGTNSFTATAGNQLVDITGWNLAALTVTPPANGDADFSLTVRAISSEAGGGTATSMANLNVDVLPVNDAPTVAAPAAIGVVEDVPSPVTGIVFGDVDAGSSPVTATFTVAQGTLSAVPGGGVAVGGIGTALTLTGTVVDINAFIAAGNLRYATVTNDTTPVALTASLNDLGNTGAGGPLASPGANVALNVTLVNDAPVFGSVTLSVDPGGAVVLTSANLSATDVDDAWASLVFFIGNLQNGFFELVGNPGVAVTSFTQGQVGAGAVRFVQSVPSGAPSYVVFVTDGTSLVGPAAVALTFQPAIGVVPARAPGLDAATLPTVRFGATTLGTSNDDLEGLSGTRSIRPPLLPIAGGGDSQAAAEEPRVATTAGARHRTLGAVAYPGLGFAGDRLPTSVPRLDFTIRPARHGDEPHGFDFSLDSAWAAGIALSVGAAWWAGRASGLLSSLLASTPTWRHVDPLPVLGRDRDDEPTGWGEPDAEEEKREEAVAGEMFGGGTEQPRG